MTLKLTNQELQYLKLCVRNYPGHTEINNLSNGVLNKLFCYNAASSAYYDILKYKNVIEDIDKGNIKVALTSEHTVPSFVFTDCGETLSLPKELPGRNDNLTSEFTYSNTAAYQLNIKQVFTASPRGGVNSASLTLTELESEILLAFLIYHKLKSKGVCCSGLTPEDCEECQDYETSKEDSQEESR